MVCQSATAAPYSRVKLRNLWPGAWIRRHFRVNKTPLAHASSDAATTP